MSCSPARRSIGRLISLAALLACSFLSASRPAAAESATSVAEITRRLSSGEPLVFATFGDSITWPCYHTDFRQNYVTLTVDALRKAYPKANVQIVHAGNMGTTGRGLAETRYQRYVLDKHPDVIFLMFGMNDCGGGPDGLELFDQNLAELIHQARAAGALPIVLTQNEIIYDCPDGAGRRALPQYMERALQVAEREQVPSADCFADWKPLANDRAALIARLNDWIHPNLAGHRWFAKSIVSQLWPEAAGHVETAVRPLTTTRGEPCLLPGPGGKQVVRTANGTWFALSGWRLGKRISDLVLSHSSAQEPTWSDFSHVTLIGSEAAALFADDDKEITAAMLLEREATLFVVFSWNTGVFYLSLNVSAPEWTERIGTAAAWRDFSIDPFRRPAPIINNQLGNGLLFDSYLLETGTPVVLCRDRKKAPGAGWEVLDGEDGISLVSGTGDSRQVDFKFPSCEFARCSLSPTGDLRFVAQTTWDAPIQVGNAGSDLIPIDLSGPQWISMSTGLNTGFVLATPAVGPQSSALPTAILWNEVSDIQTLQLAGVDCIQAAFPVELDGAPAIVSVDRIADGAAPSLAFESRPAHGATTVGALLNSDGSLEFRHLRVQPIQMVKEAN